jgi:hypothetical protein
MTDYKRAYLTNAATPNLIIKYSRQDRAGEAEPGRDQIQARHGGVENAFKTLLLDEGADPMVVGNSFEQMTSRGAGGRREPDRCRGGVPAIVAGLKEGLDAATYSNYELAMRRFADLTMRPNWRSACARWRSWSTVPAGARLWFDASGIAALRQGEKERPTRWRSSPPRASLINAGYSPDSVKAALAASDVTLLDHTGLVSVQLQKPNSQLKELSAPKPADVPAGPTPSPRMPTSSPAKEGSHERALSRAFASPTSRFAPTGGGRTVHGIVVPFGRTAMVSDGGTPTARSSSAARSPRPFGSAAPRSSCSPSTTPAPTRSAAPPAP